MRPQSIVMLVDASGAPDGTGGASPAGADGAGQSGLRALILRTLDPAQWRLVHCHNVESAHEHFQAGPIGGLIPELVVLNVDVPRGWPFCTTLKKNFATVPVIVVSERLNKEVFNGHQKLDTRADAYHRLPEELDGLEISLGYFASHKSETGEEDEGSSPRLKPRKAERVAVPSALLKKLEETVAEQARSLEDARQKIEALEAERDAVADKNRRQVIELMALHPSDSGAEVASLREKVAALEARSNELARLDEEARQLRAALGAAKAEVARLGERPDAEALVTRLQSEVQALKANEGELRRTLDTRAVELAALTTERDQLVERQKEARDKARVSSPGQQAPGAALQEAREDARREAVEAADQLAKASVQLSTLATELKNSHERRLQAEEALRRAEARAAELEQELSHRPSAAGADLEARLMEALARAEAAERAAAAEKSRAEQVLSLSQGATSELERLANEKRASDEALAMSRRLMREYATDAARKADELKEEQAKNKALAERAEAAEKLAAELSQSAEFGSSLVESLEREVAELRAHKAAGGGGDAAEREVLQKNLEQLAAGYRGLQAELEAAAHKLAEANTKAAQANQELDEARAEVFALTVEREHLVEKGAASAASLAAMELELARLNKELESAGHDHDAMLETLQAEFGELTKRQAADAAALAAERGEKAALLARVEALVAEVDQEKRARQFVYQAMTEHADVVAERFEALRVYARRLEGRLIEAEARRAELEARLEALLSEVRAQALYGEVPPVMEIPLAPVFIDEDDEDEEDEDKGEGEGGEADTQGDVEAEDGTDGAGVEAKGLEAERGEGPPAERADDGQVQAAPAPVDAADLLLTLAMSSEPVPNAEVPAVSAPDTDTGLEAGHVLPPDADPSLDEELATASDDDADLAVEIAPTSAADTSVTVEIAPPSVQDAGNTPEAPAGSAEETKPTS